MIYKSPYPNANAVQHVLFCGYQHLSQASQRMRKALSHSKSTDLEAFIASTLALMPFAAASQQVNHWISSQLTTGRSIVKLSSTPRDMIIFVRGVRAMLEMLPSDLPVIGCNPLIDIGQGLEKANTASVDILESSVTETSFSKGKIISCSRQALFRLGTRLESLCSEFNETLNDEIIACKMAFEVLKQIRNGVESLGPSEPRRLLSGVAMAAQATPWLQSFIRIPCEVEGTVLLPHNHLTRLLLSFYAQVPQQYLDLVLPLLDQRLETPVDASSDWFALSVTRTQAFALDVYAHWSVLMSLVEEESWWIGRLPLTTLDGVVNRYGIGFIRRLWPECGNEDWWPGEMLRMLRDAKSTS
ncbi:hypothetical protein SVAN01_07160 [Stagonosporopsis vannaccii]|nr:hypothetical protein SVAN01_07160 [Stagonosporopsis vannaccii]